MNCPNCDLENPPEAERCDCGFEFLNHDDSSETSKQCPFCKEMIKVSALKCKHCGEFLDDRVRPHQEKWNRGIAAVLSLVIPGSGQMYKGQIFNGLIWLVMVFIGYCFFIVPGIPLHLLCILGAASGDVTK